jgi:hypothetical protein
VQDTLAAHLAVEERPFGDDLNSDEQTLDAPARF